MAITAQGLYVNLAVADLKRTRAFWEAMGFGFNPMFSDDNALALELGNGFAAMLLKREFFQTFTNRAPCDTGTHVEAINALQVASREEVDALMTKALDAGATEPRPAQDLGFMYQRSFLDLDGHHWELFQMSGNPPA